MNARNMPGFTAENATLTAPAHYRTAGVFESQSSPAYVQPAYKNIACAYLWKAVTLAPWGSIQRTALNRAYEIAC
jgi:hypothetical protein